MSDIVYVTQVEPLEGHEIRATFSDGAVKDINLGELLSAGGVFTLIDERREIFEQARVNPESRTVEWPGEIDLDPEVLYGRHEPASGHRITRRTVRGPSVARRRPGAGRCLRNGWFSFPLTFPARRSALRP